MMDNMKPSPVVGPLLNEIRRLPFVKGLDFSEGTRGVESGTDGILRVRTPEGVYSFLVEQKRSYLDRGILNALIAYAKLSDKKRHEPLLLLARFIPKPSGQRLIDAGVNFLDQAGNMHLVLGRNYERTIIGNKENGAAKEDQRFSPASTQLLFTFATIEQAGTWTVRQLAEASGLSKSNVANVQQQLADREILKKSGRGFEFRDKVRLQEELLRGYEIALRPKLLIGRFRSPHKDLDGTIAEINEAFRALSIRWSVMGGPAAYAIQRFYRGLELPIFLDSFPEQLSRRLRILPDKTGPLILLHSFGTMPFWREAEPFLLAHPWLIYSELMNSSDSRAHEAAAELKREYLS